jgi:heme-degrading monooxygenase HmoA
MITIGMYYDVIPGKEAVFEEKFRAVVGALEKGPGHKASFLYKRHDDPSSYLIISEWDSQEAFGAFIRSDAFKAVTDWGKAEILRGRPRHHVYETKPMGRPGA